MQWLEVMQGKKKNLKPQTQNKQGKYKKWTDGKIHG